MKLLLMQTSNNIHYKSAFGLSKACIADGVVNIDVVDIDQTNY